MGNNYMSLVIFLAIQSTVLPIDMSKKIEELKQKILHETPPPSHLGFPNYYDYLVTDNNTLITPIINYPHLHRHHTKKKRFRINEAPSVPTERELIVVSETTTDVTTKQDTRSRNDSLQIAPEIKELKKTIAHISEKIERFNGLTTHKTNVLRSRSKEHPLVKLSHKHLKNHSSFHKGRRFIMTEEERNKPQRWTHCLDLITPRLKGYNEVWRPKEIAATDGDVRKLAHLLSVNVSEYSKDEIISTLFQISNIRIKIYQWDFTALTGILNIIIRDSNHSFKTLKHGIKRMFRRWHLDTSDLKTFQKQTRIFRPPCIDTSHYSGSTKTTGGVRYSRKPGQHKRPVIHHDSKTEDADSFLNRIHCSTKISEDPYSIREAVDWVQQLLKENKQITSMDFDKMFNSKEWVYDLPDYDKSLR